MCGTPLHGNPSSADQHTGFQLCNQGSGFGHHITLTITLIVHEALIITLIIKLLVHEALIIVLIMRELNGALRLAVLPSMSPMRVRMRMPMVQATM